jgi:hypothetical protein
MTLSSQFSVSQYGLKVAGVLARAWRDKLQFYLDVEQVNEAGPGMALGCSAFQAYEEPEALGRLATEAFGPLRQHILQLRSLLQPA